MRKRAADVDRTRQRIVEATVGLHRTVGLDATVTDIAEAAGVTRATVYRHFPDDAALFAACSSHWRSQQRLPAPSRWKVGESGGLGLRTALADLYRYYAEGADLLTNVYRTLDRLPPDVARANADETAGWRQDILEIVDPPPDRRPATEAVVAHVTSFPTWRSLVVEHGVAEGAAVELMAGLVEQAASSR